ncbi:M23 family metallopeptidase [Chroococcidiopsis sp. TS-821]|uniref:M23 family metallopeptidase n=1 Tax=Chroococcidiopsis sp. TS-821 TaxID=1378066 RepID=UPI000D3F9828|nr:M23 family metallopeptidase [Chroococcidiopsis sp. TS-821]PPS40935.1 hypothetical protein B1A85_18670 [Chroococcidiopsis sp. TS-821]
MKQGNENASAPSSYFGRRSLLLPSLTCLGVVSLLSHQPALAQASIDSIVVPIKEDTTPSPTNSNDAHQARVERLRQKLATPAVPVKPEASQQVATPQKRPQTVLPNTPTAQKPQATNPTPDFSRTHIDPTNYSIGATKTYEPPSAVVLSERSTGCRAVVRNGQGAASACPTVPQRTNVAIRNPRSRSALTRIPTSNQIASVSPVRGSSASYIKTSGAKEPPAYIQQAIALVNQSVSPSTQAYYNRMQQQGVRIRNTGLLFPLTIPAPITSLFGWRIHPITGDRRFHAGIDLGAPTGTPVLAAYTGKVAIADFLGGYGLTVVLEHEKLAKSSDKTPLENTPPQQTLYGHLSEIFVQPGDRVKQGTVIGLVGSTGNSTGPHLHFETRHLTPEGWVASDPGFELEYALTKLVEALKTAQAEESEKS